MVVTKEEAKRIRPGDILLYTPRGGIGTPVPFPIIDVMDVSDRCVALHIKIHDRREDTVYHTYYDDTTKRIIYTHN